MRRFIYFVFFCLVFFSAAVHAQLSEIDSLRKYISARGDDSLKVNAWISLSGKYLDTDLQEAIRCGYKALDLADEIDFQKGRAYAYKAIGIGNYYQANYPEAVIQFENSLAVFDSLSLKVGVANILSNLGATYFNAGDDTKAIDYYLRSLRISEEINDRLRIGTALNNIGGVYNNKDITLDKSLVYMLKALGIFREIDYREGIATGSMNAGEIYHKKKMYDSAIYYFEASLAVYDESVEATFPLTYLGEIYGERKDYARAYAYHNKAIKIAEGVEAKLELIQSIVGLAKTQKNHGEIKASIASYQRAQKLAEEVQARQELKYIYEGLSGLFAGNREFEKAYQYNTLLATVKDSLFNRDNYTN
jgi:tetratricopeptide (TPR) repeat protein